MGWFIDVLRISTYNVLRISTYTYLQCEINLMEKKVKYICFELLWSKSTVT